MNLVQLPYQKSGCRNTQSPYFYLPLLTLPSFVCHKLPQINQIFILDEDGDFYNHGNFDLSLRKYTVGEKPRVSN